MKCYACFSPPSLYIPHFHFLLHGLPKMRKAYSLVCCSLLGMESQNIV